MARPARSPSPEPDSTSCIPPAIARSRIASRNASTLTAETVPEPPARYPIRRGLSRGCASTDGGATFGSAVLVAGHPIEPRIEQFRMVAAGSSLYVAYLVGDPGGDVGLRLRRSDDMGRTWTFPSILVARGNLRHGLSDLALGADASGRVAVACAVGVDPRAFVSIAAMPFVLRGSGRKSI